MAQDIKELKDNMNDLLIDKHLWNVVVSNNLKDSETSDDNKEGKEKPKTSKKRTQNKTSNNATKDNNNKEKGE